MAALADFAKYVRPEVAGCADVVLLDAILRAGIEFCKRTKVFKQVITVNTIVNQSSYTLATLTDTEPDEILNVKRDEYDALDASSFKEFENDNLDTLSGTPNYYYLDVDNKMVLGKLPEAVEALKVTVKIRPTKNATTLPNELVNRYQHQIASGAKSILMLMKGQAWTDVQMASVHASLFEQAIFTANLRDAKGAARKPLRTVSQHF